MILGIISQTSPQNLGGIGVYTRQLLAWRKPCVRGKSAALGDWSPRSRRWDDTFNTADLALAAWADANGLSISAPLTPNFSAHKGRSTVDLLVSHGIAASNVRTVGRRGLTTS